MFTWDITKAITNYEKHGVSFEEATTFSSMPMRWMGMIRDTLRMNGAAGG